MYYAIPIINRLLDMDYKYMIDGVQVSEAEAYVKVRAGAEVRQSRQAITEEQFNQAKEDALNPPA